MVLYLLMGHSVTYQWYAHAVFLLAFTYCLNNTLVFISAVASPSTQNHLQQTLYYSLYHCTAGLLFLVGCAAFQEYHGGRAARHRVTTCAPRSQHPAASASLTALWLAATTRLP
ncbi:uncharacterized protein LOC142776990 [Rhipicephalus microplus]|uniref:uncharacterized protein LOC142776990 n=1 Tax=Rhipicephalus microplus TaxID=6941 RepID=UPI003F6D0B7C